MRLHDSAGSSFKNSARDVSISQFKRTQCLKNKRFLFGKRGPFEIQKHCYSHLFRVCPLPSSLFREWSPIFCSIRENTLHLADGPEAPDTTYMKLAVAFIMKIEAALEDEASTLPSLRKC